MAAGHENDGMLETSSDSGTAVCVLQQAQDGVTYIFISLQPHFDIKLILKINALMEKERI